MKRILMAAVAACSLAAAVSPAQALVIGTANTSSSSIGFGSAGLGAWSQQVYSAASFSGPLAISQLNFYNSASPSTNTPLTGAFTIYLSTTSAAIPTFDTSNMAWPDATFTQVFSGTLSDLVDGHLDIDLSTAFNYDPSAGNLMLTVNNNYGSGGNLYLDTYKNSGVTNMRMSAYPYDLNQGLVTGFNENIAAVPEPASWAMMIAGFGLAGVAMRRQRRGLGSAAACA